VLDMGPIEAEPPLLGFMPLQPPEAVHDEAFATVQLSVVLPPLWIVLGEAASVTVGAGEGCEPD